MRASFGVAENMRVARDRPCRQSTSMTGKTNGALLSGCVKPLWDSNLRPIDP
jgi:hypothetical protein